MLKFSKMFHGDFKRQIMKQPWTKETKVPKRRRRTKRRAKNNNNETPSLDLALRAGKNSEFWRQCASFLLFFRSPCSPMTTRWKGFFSERNSRTMMCSLVYWTTFKLGSSQGKTISEWPLQYMCTILQWVTVINYFYKGLNIYFLIKSYLNGVSFNVIFPLCFQNNILWDF